MANRPFGQSYIDRNTSNIDPNYIANQLQLVGFQPQQPIPSKIINTLHLIGALWETYLDYGTIRTTDYLEPTTQRWSATKLSYNIGDSVITGGATPATRAIYYFGGYRIETDQPLLVPAGAEPLLKPTAIKPGRLWIYLDTSLIVDPAMPFASVRVEIAGPGVDDTPGGGEVTIGGVEIDAAGEITSNIYSTLPEPIVEMVFGNLPYRFITGMTFEGAIQFDGNVQVDGTLDVDGNATIGAGVANVHTLNGNNTLGTDGTSVHTVNGDMTGTGRRTSGAITAPSIEATGASPVALTEGATVTANKSITGDVTTPLTMGLITALAKIVAAAAGVEGPGTTAVALPEGATIPTGKALTLAGTATIGGGQRVEGATVEGAVFEVTSPGAAPTARQFGAGTDDALVYNDGVLKLVHTSINGRVYATGDQEASSAMGLDGTTAATTVAVKGLGLGNVRVIVDGLIQLAALPNSFQLFLQENQTNDPAWTTVGTSATIAGLKDALDVNDWQPFRLERIFAAGVIFATLYRLRVRADPTTAAVKEVRVRVESERA